MEQQRDPRGRKPTCECGDCHKCKRRVQNREYMRLYNAGERRPREFKGRREWTAEDDAVLGTDYDGNVARVLGTTASAVANRRVALGIASHRPPGRPRTNDRGYRTVVLSKSDPLHCMARSDGSVMEHRVVMARHLGRPLKRSEFVHHRNGFRQDNRIENLELWSRAHPDGQRVSDMLQWAREFIEQYEQAGLQKSFFHMEPAV